MTNPSAGVHGSSAATEESGRGTTPLSAGVHGSGAATASDSESPSVASDNEDWDADCTAQDDAVCQPAILLCDHQNCHVPTVVLDYDAMFGTMEEAEEYVKRVAASHGAGIKRTGGLKWTKKGILKRCRPGCIFSGDPAKNTKLWGCPFQVTLNRRTDKDRPFWYVSKSSKLLHCSHPFGAKVVASASGTRCLPDKVKAFVRGRRVDRISPESVISQVKEMFPGVWITPEMVTSLWRVTDEESVADLERLLNGGSTTFRGKVLKNHKDVLSGAFWLCLESKESLMASHKVILCDATYKTNRYRMPLVLMSGTDNCGLTFPIAAAVVERENKAAYDWVFDSLCDLVSSEFHLDLEKELGVVVTDKDGAECEAVEKKFGRERHVLCIFHMFRNVDRNLSPILREEFGSFLRKFRDTIFAKTPGQLDAKIADLYKEYEAAVPYLSKHIFDSKEKVCYAFTKHLPTLGNRTTGRAECMNGLLKKRCRGSSSITQVMGSLHLVEQAYYDKREKIIIRHSYRRYRGGDLLDQSLRDVIPPPLWSKVFKEVHRPMKGIHVPYQRAEGDWACTCGFYENRLLPCRHIYAALRQSVSLFCQEDLNPMFHFACDPCARPPVQTVPTTERRTRSITRKGSEFEEDVISNSDLKASFSKALDCAEESGALGRRKLHDVLDAYVAEMRTPSSVGKGGCLPPVRRGKGRRSTKVKHNGTGGRKRQRQGKSSEKSQRSAKRRRVMD